MNSHYKCSNKITITEYNNNIIYYMIYWNCKLRQPFNYHRSIYSTNTSSSRYR